MGPIQHIKKLCPVQKVGTIQHLRRSPGPRVRTKECPLAQVEVEPEDPGGLSGRGENFNCVFFFLFF